MKLRTIIIIVVLLAVLGSVFFVALKFVIFLVLILACVAFLAKASPKDG